MTSHLPHVFTYLFIHSSTPVELLSEGDDRQTSLKGGAAMLIRFSRLHYQTCQTLEKTAMSLLAIFSPAAQEYHQWLPSLRICFRAVSTPLRQEGSSQPSEFDLAMSSAFFSSSAATSLHVPWSKSLGLGPLPPLACLVYAIVFPFYESSSNYFTPSPVHRMGGILYLGARLRGWRQQTASPRSRLQMQGYP